MVLDDAALVAVNLGVFSAARVVELFSRMPSSRPEKRYTAMPLSSGATSVTMLSISAITLTGAPSNQ